MAENKKYTELITFEEKKNEYKGDTGNAHRNRFSIDLMSHPNRRSYECLGDGYCALRAAYTAMIIYEIEHLENKLNLLRENLTIYSKSSKADDKELIITINKNWVFACEIPTSHVGKDFDNILLYFLNITIKHIQTLKNITPEEQRFKELKRLTDNDANLDMNAMECMKLSMLFKFEYLKRNYGLSDIYDGKNDRRNDFVDPELIDENLKTSFAGIMTAQEPSSKEYIKIKLNPIGLTGKDVLNGVQQNDFELFARSFEIIVNVTCDRNVGLWDYEVTFPELKNKPKIPIIKEDKLD